MDGGMIFPANSLGEASEQPRKVFMYPLKGLGVWYFRFLEEALG
jgi:hypothetical protein